MGAILPAIGLGIDLIVKLIGAYNSLPSSDEATKVHLRDLSDRLTETKRLVAAVVIKEV
ncbi:hypothetical protein LCGC14_2826160 [marine sediment metagenome]|uniref:Uncharacterized protein n=1 Tax=marine sediment metagenome TaxID=412755 RepID=A0A0F8Z275_9ZZZZ